jgi:hypothetical protein
MVNLIDDRKYQMIDLNVILSECKKMTDSDGKIKYQKQICRLVSM